MAKKAKERSHAHQRCIVDLECTVAHLKAQLNKYEEQNAKEEQAKRGPQASAQTA
jgi:hypothetical protein